MLNMLKVHTLPSTTAGSRAGNSSGRVTWRKRCQPVAPSTSAACSRSRGMAWSAPSVTTIMKGKPSQVLVVRLAAKAVLNWLNHETGSTPTRPSTALTAPNCFWNMPFQMRAVM